MSSHRVHPEPRVVIRRFMTHVIAQLKPLVPIIQRVMEAQREQRQLMPLWSSDPPSVPAGHVWTLPGVGTSKLDRALWWGEPGNLRDNATVARLANARRYEPIPGWKPPTPTRVRIFDYDGALIGESGEPELITSQSAEDQRAHEEDADD